MPIYHTRWQHRALYSNTNHTHTHTASNEGMGRAVKNGLEIIIETGAALKEEVESEWRSV